jgi:hypothetical protein
MSQNQTLLTNFFCSLALILSLACFGGCPDYSHLRPQPDYSNMTDSGAESDEVDAENANP